MFEKVFGWLECDIWDYQGPEGKENHCFFHLGNAIRTRPLPFWHLLLGAVLMNAAPAADVLACHDSPNHFFEELLCELRDCGLSFPKMPAIKDLKCEAFVICTAIPSQN